MKDFEWMYQHALHLKGSVDDLEGMLPQPFTAKQLTAIDDSRYLSTMTRRIFRAGLKHSMVDAKWPFFEEVFFGFEPQKLVLMSDEMLEKTLQDKRLIRHWGKIKSIRSNAAMVLELSEQHGGFGRFLANWPGERIIELWQLLARQGAHLGGNSAAYFLRMSGKDTFILTNDVIAALKAQDIIDKKPTAKAEFQALQQVFNLWQKQSQRPLCQISRLLSFCVD